MTLSEIEGLLGRHFTMQESCLRGEYYLIVEHPLAGQAVCIDISTRRHRYDQTTDVRESLARAEQPCVAVAVHRWSRIAWLNNHEWTRWLIGLPSDV